MKKLAIVFPGIGYHCDKPLLYYTRKLAQRQGCTECICLTYSCGGGNIRGNAEKMESAFRSLYAQTEECLKNIKFGEYDDVLFIAKSIGTIIAACYAKEYAVGCRMLLLTPLIHTFSWEIADAAAFIGSADPWSDTEEVVCACKRQNIPIHVYEGADHSLETGDVMKNLEILMDVAKRSEAFIRGDVQTESCLLRAAALAMQVLESDEPAAEYVQALLALRNTLLETDEKEIERLKLSDSIRMSLNSDKGLMRSVVLKEADQVSLLSTLAVYTACRREGLPEHSAEYMDRVTALRRKIDKFYGEKSQQFCGR